MSSRWLREISTNASGNGTGIPFAMKCWAWFLTELLGFTNYTEGGTADGFKSYSVNGTNGEFNLTGTDEDFRDTVAAAFNSSDVGKFIVVKDSVHRNCGIYQITAYTSATTVTLDFRSAATEYPTASTGISWWLISAAASAAAGSLSFQQSAKYNANPNAFYYGWLVLDDGQGINSQRAFVFFPNCHYIGGWPDGDMRNWCYYAIYAGGSPSSGNPWHTGVIAPNLFNRQNTLVGKTLNITAGASSATVTFSGTNPLSISQAITQINAAFGYQVCYESDGLGYNRSGGGYLTFRVWPTGAPASGAPAYPISDYGRCGHVGQLGGPGLNNLTLTYSGSTAWSDLGLTGTTHIDSSFSWSYCINLDCRLDLNYTPAVYTAAQLASWFAGQINSWTGDLFSASGGLAISNTVGGSHGNQSIGCGAGGIIVSFFGMLGGSPPTATGDYFRCRTPHAQGWEIELAILSGITAPCVRVRVSTDGSWDSTGKILGPVYFGSVASAVNWIYAEGNTDGSSVHLMVHQATNDRTNGAMACNIIPQESGHATTEKVALMGNVGTASSDYDNGNLTHSYDTKRVGHGYYYKEWPNALEPAAPRDIYMMQFSYGGGSNGLETWGSREKNRRRSGSGSGTGDSFSLTGTTITLTDAGAAWVVSDVGKTIKISGSTTPGNDGLFVITARISATQITYENASGATEAFTGTWAIADYQDLILGTRVIGDVNNAAGEFELLGRLVGHYGVRYSLGNRTAFSEDSPHAKDKFHMASGFSFDWPGVTPQH